MTECPIGTRGLLKITSIGFALNAFIRVSWRRMIFEGICRRKRRCGEERTGLACGRTPGRSGREARRLHFDTSNAIYIHILTHGFVFTKSEAPLRGVMSFREIEIQQVVRISDPSSWFKTSGSLPLVSMKDIVLARWWGLLPNGHAR